MRYLIGLYKILFMIGGLIKIVLDSKNIVHFSDMYLIVLTMIAYYNAGVLALNIIGYPLDHILLAKCKNMAVIRHLSNKLRVLIPYLNKENNVILRQALNNLYKDKKFILNIVALLISVILLARF